MIKNKLVVRNISLVIILLLLIFIIVKIRNRSPFGKGETNFAAGFNEEISGIELSSGIEKVILTLEGNVWKVNGEKEARKSAMVCIITFLQNMEIKSPVSPEMFEKEITLKGIRPVRVKVFAKRRLLRSFYVYKTASNKYGNIMKMKERTRPFIVQEPGYDGNIGLVFNTNELYWLPYTVFNLLPSEISSVTIENSINPSYSFFINNTGNNLQLSDMKEILTGWDSSRVKRYISYFTHVPFERLAFDIKDHDKKRIETSEPAYRISVKKVDGRIIRLSLWERITEGKKDTGRLWGKTTDSDEIMIIRYFDIDPLLRKITYFFPEE